MSIVGGQDKTPVETTNDFLSIATLLGNPARLKAEYEKLEAAKKEAEAVVKLVGPANEILALREQAKKDSSLAASALARARMEAETLMKSAQSKADAVAAAAEGYSEKIGKEVQKAKEDVARALAEANSAKIDFEKRKSNIDDMMNAVIAKASTQVENAKKAMAEAEAEIAETRKVRSKLEEVTRLIAEALRVGSP